MELYAIVFKRACVHSSLLKRIAKPWQNFCFNKSCCIWWTYFDYQKPGPMAQKTNDTRSLLKDALLISIQL